jgi:putative Holliday junction resolvase
MRTLAIDFGEKRIGLAISDPEGTVAVPLDTLVRKSDRTAAQQIAEIARREGIASLVLGEPLRADGTKGPAAERVHLFARHLREATGLPVELVEETLSSVEAARRLREAGVSARRVRQDPGRLDAIAAQLLLQEHLDRARTPKRN